MTNVEKNAVYNPEARENRGGGYRALEAEAVEKSVARILASKAEAEARGFDMSMNVDYQTMDNNQNG